MNIPGKYIIAGVVLLVVGLIIGAAVSPALSGSAQSTEADVAAVASVFDEYSAAANAGDFERWISNWAEEGTQYFPDAPPRYGKEEIGAAMQPAFEILDFEGFAIDIDEVQVFGNQDYAHGTYG